MNNEATTAELRAIIRKMATQGELLPPVGRVSDDSLWPAVFSSGSCGVTFAADLTDREYSLIKEIVEER